MISGTPMSRRQNRQRVSVAPERIAYLQARGQEVAVEQAVVAADGAAADAATAYATAQDVQSDLSDTLNGTAAFTGLNVAGVDVSPFLAKTDGERLVDADGLEDQLVPTAKIEANAATESLTSYDASSISINGSGEKVLRSQPVTLLAGEKLEIQTGVSIYALGKNGAATGQLMSTVMLRIYRDTTMIYETAASPTLHAVPIPVVVSPEWEDSPGPGTYIYELRLEHTASGDVSSSTASSRLLRLKRVKL